MDGGGGQAAKVGYTFHKDTDSSAVSSLSNRNKYSSQHMAETVVGSSLAPHMSSLMAPNGSIGPVVHLHSLTGSVKSQLQNRLGHSYPHAWCLRIVQECSFKVNPSIGFQYLCNLDQFLQTQSHNYNCINRESVQCSVCSIQTHCV